MGLLIVAVKQLKLLREYLGLQKIIANYTGNKQNDVQFLEKSKIKMAHAENPIMKNCSSHTQNKLVLLFAFKLLEQQILQVYNKLILKPY